MVGFRSPGPCLHFVDSFHTDIDAGDVKRRSISNPGPIGLLPAEANYSYSVSGTTGALGGVLFSETHRLPGTWYDRTDSTNMLRSNEAALGKSKYANEDFRKSAKITKQNITSPSKVDADIHFETNNGLEKITVRGQHGTQSFRFDFNQLDAKLKKLPKNTDVMKPFMDTIAKIFAAVLELR